MPKESQAPRRAVVYCIIPQDLAVELHDPLRRHFADETGVQVIVEQRWRGRRDRPDRREAHAPETRGDERRRIHAADGRRVADRRVAAVPVEAPSELPRKARHHSERLLFIERLEPSTEQLEDRDTARLVGRFQAGDHEVFATLYVRYFDRVYAYLRMVVRDEFEAEDLAQQTFLSVFQNLERYERRRQPFRAWLFRIARNAALMHVKKHSRMDLTDAVVVDEWSLRPSDDDALSERLAGNWISDRELTLFVERLPLAQRQIIALIYLLDLGMAEVATVMNMRPDAIRAAHSRALRHLEQRLSAVGRGATQRSRSPMRIGVRQALVLRSRRFALHG